MINNEAIKLAIEDLELQEIPNYSMTEEKLLDYINMLSDCGFASTPQILQNIVHEMMRDKVKIN
ncbi:hypothetical protein PAAG_11800 [Paracoccidioides lutzii Pb01]|uniref:Uncharacterized protein n=1 Tax=Paracoccidioides lutzii (strain ATCC MYA-826 / Pb01) TaxID=502779 RepID=A0A0A2V504_PARBA|nr:hypothetical protein PAAG_11800 [Paracoccidioides lutzii Pb01]KGQ01452.1 hypothetical protein PAAG_11800 [Paracoccidioides lutzii Pb01]